MLDLTELQILAQLADNMEIAIKKMEKYYEENNAENFNMSKKEILGIQNKISEMIK